MCVCFTLRPAAVDVHEEQPHLSPHWPAGVATSAPDLCLSLQLELPPTQLEREEERKSRSRDDEWKRRRRGRDQFEGKFRKHQSVSTFSDWLSNQSFFINTETVCLQDITMKTEQFSHTEG